MCDNVFGQLESKLAQDLEQQQRPRGWCAATFLNNCMGKLNDGGSFFAVPRFQLFRLSVGV
jgi:hypothetical protein